MTATLFLYHIWNKEEFDSLLWYYLNTHHMKTIITLIITLISMSCHAYEISEAGKAFIKEHESLVLTVDKYNQIGYGHLYKKGEKVKKQITKAEAEQLFNKDIAEVNASINRLLSKFKNIKFSQNFIDGLGSLIYNCGEEGVKQSDFYARLLRCRLKNNNIHKQDFEYTLVAVKTMRCNSYKGLKIRRQNEYKLMVA